MYDPAIPMEQDIPIMAILDLQEIHNQTIGGQRSRKSGFGPMQVVYVVRLEELLEGFDPGMVLLEFLEQPIHSDGLLEHLHNAAVRTHRQYLVGRQQQGHSLQFEDVVEL